MNGAIQGKWNLMQKKVLEMGKREMRPTWTYTLGHNNISIEKEEKDVGVVMQDNLSPEKLIHKIFGDTSIMLRNTQMAFHFLDQV